MLIDARVARLARPPIGAAADPIDPDFASPRDVRRHRPNADQLASKRSMQALAAATRQRRT
jgi:hypothetical protein